MADGTGPTDAVTKGQLRLSQLNDVDLTGITLADGTPLAATYDLASQLWVAHDALPASAVAIAANPSVGLPASNLQTFASGVAGQIGTLYEAVGAKADQSAVDGLDGRLIVIEGENLDSRVSAIEALGFTLLSNGNVEPVGHGLQVDVPLPGTNGLLVEGIIRPEASETPTFGVRTAFELGSTTEAAASQVFLFHGNLAILGMENPLLEPCGQFLSIQMGTAAHPVVGSAWLTDYHVHGPIGRQAGGLQGISQLINNYYNGQPSRGPSTGAAITSRPGIGVSPDHGVATTYPVDVGLAVVGYSGAPGSPSRSVGFVTAFQAGGDASLWLSGDRSKLEKCFVGQDWTDRGLLLLAPHPDANGASAVTAELRRRDAASAPILSAASEDGSTVVGSINHDGAYESAAGMILKSPSGNRYRLTVADDGTISTVAA